MSNSFRQSGSLVAPGCLPLLLLFLFIGLLPFIMADAMMTALSKLGLTGYQSLWIAMGIFIGGMINIPVRKIERQKPVASNSTDFLGISKLINHQKSQSYTLLAVNLGGCLIPLALCAYQIERLLPAGWEAMLSLIVAVLINIAVCYRLAKPVQNVGIALPALIPALTAVAAALLLYPEQAPAIAFTSGVMGPLVGADLLHLRKIESISTRTASIGGAGTFDGIVISSLLATLLA
jgi:uncharacterized membrane protein